MQMSKVLNTFKKITVIVDVDGIQQHPIILDGDTTRHLINQFGESALYESLDLLAAEVKMMIEQKLLNNRIKGIKK